ncbi:cytochrome P450 [Xylaria cf. heliscus]|nr:cytochrome P450 [Xylaria cf. heliscus]
MMFEVFVVMSQPVAFCLWIFCTGTLSLWLWSAISLIHHVHLARTTRLPFLILPCSLLGAPWRMAQFIMIPIVKSLPERLTRNWLPFLLINELWHNGYEPFERLGTDTFLAVSPGGLILYTCDPDVNVQLFRDGNSGKPVELISILNVHGPTITGTDGPESRLYRKIAAPFFSESTLRRVFTQSTSGAKLLLAALMRPDAHLQLRTLSASLSLNTLCQINFGDQTDSDLVQALAFQDNIPDGKTLSYSQALHGLIKSLGMIFRTPHWILRLSPFRSHRHAVACYSELESYMSQLKQARQGTLSKTSVHEPPLHEDLLDLLIQSGVSSQDQAITVLTNGQVIGQLFLFMFAGEGSRGCLGRRFGLVQICAVVATLFKTHSVELVTNREHGDEEAWLEARRRAALALSEGTRFDTSLRAVKNVPIRFIERKN